MVQVQTPSLSGSGCHPPGRIASRAVQGFVRVGGAAGRSDGRGSRPAMEEWPSPYLPDSRTKSTLSLSLSPCSQDIRDAR
jgi:hypothetical protein